MRRTPLSRVTTAKRGPARTVALQYRAAYGKRSYGIIIIALGGTRAFGLAACPAALDKHWKCPATS